MIKEKKSVVRAVSNLNMLTKSGQLKWGVRKLPSDWYVDSGQEKMVNPAYDTEHEGKYLRLFRYTGRHYHDEESYTIVAYTALCIIDFSGTLVWEFPPDRSIHDLYETVSYKEADVESFLNKLAEGYQEEEEKQEKEENDLPF